jgi:hypothetical protein
MDEREFRTLLRRGMITTLEPLDSVIGAWGGRLRARPAMTTISPTSISYCRTFGRR